MENTSSLAELRELLSPYLSANQKKLNKMMFYRNRLKSFSSWPFSATDLCSAENMAAAGFYSISKKKNDTSVKCFCCSKELDGWEAMDDPWEEHKMHQVDCPFVKLNKTEKDWTLEDWIDMHESWVLKLLDKNVTTELENLQYRLHKLNETKMQKEKKKKRR